MMPLSLPSSSCLRLLLPTLLCFFSLLSAGANAAQLEETTSSGEAIFNDNCALCHVQQAGEEIPGLSVLQEMSGNAILATMVDGVMRIQASLLSDSERVAVAEYLGGPLTAEQPLRFEVGMCDVLDPVTEAAPEAVWNGWGRDVANTRFRSDTGGLTAANVSRLRLQWAFGVPDVEQMRSQPAVYGEHLFIGSQSGMVFALNAKTGCTYWSFKAAGGVRAAMNVGEITVDGEERKAVFFNDAQAIAYALDAETGALIWSRKVDDHPAAAGTGGLQLHEGVLYVPVSGLSEEAIANTAGNDYRCCSFRGNITALDATTGEQLWKSYTIPEPSFVRELDNGKELWGPAGVAVWNTPTVDAKRGLLYIATGNAYVEPPVETSNAIVAMDLQTGEIVWVNQVLESDIWSGGCDAALGGDPENPGCFEEVGPDFDFSAPPVLATMADGRDILIATQKSGLGFAFDPDNAGETLWDYRWGQGAAAGGVYGTASDGERAYFAVADNWTSAPGGLHGVDLATGERAWFTPPQDLLCNSSVPGCAANQSAAVTVIPGVVFSGSADGGMRAYSSATGDVLWTYNTNREFETVNGMAAQGGSIDGPGVVIVDGMLYVTAGNGGFFGTPGNVLLAFSIE